MKTDTDKRLVLLHPNDNIFVCCQTISAGESVVLEGESLVIHSDIHVGHKLARSDIALQEKIIKYGASIGSAKASIQRAEHVHLHNIKSDYMPSYQRSGVVDDNLVQTKAEEK